MVEPRAQHTHVDAAAKGVVVLLQLLQHGTGTALVQGVEIGNDGGQPTVQFRTLLAQGLQVLLHIGIYLAAVQAQCGIGIHQQVEVEDEVLVALPQVACLAEQAHALLHLDGIDGVHSRCRHHYRGRRSASQHLAVPHDDVPVLEQVEVVDLVAVQEQVERLAVQTVLRVGLEQVDALVAVPADDAQVILVVLIVKEQLGHVERVGHQALIHPGTAQVLVGQLLEGVLHQVKLCQRAGNRRAGILAQAAVGVLDTRDIVVAVRVMPYPVFLAVLARVVVIG